MDRVPHYECVGWRFESSHPHQESAIFRFIHSEFRAFFYALYHCSPFINGPGVSPGHVLIHFFDKTSSVCFNESLQPFNLSFKLHSAVGISYSHSLS